MSNSNAAITMLVILDLQHIGKPGKKDLGGAHDLDGDGLVEQGENEADLTPIYVEAAVETLQAQGIHTEVLSKGSYAERWKQAAKLANVVNGPVAYVACHLNMGEGDYGLVCFDDRSAGGARMAREIGAELTQAFSRPELRRVISDPRAATSNFPRALNTIKGIYKGPANLSGVCFEPLFLDSHATLLGALTEREAAEKLASEEHHTGWLKSHSGKTRKKKGGFLKKKPARDLTAGERRAADRQSSTLGRVGRALAAGVVRWLDLNR